MAIYLENTLACAKSHDKSTAGQKKEALQVALSTKELLKKICAAQRAIEANAHLHTEELSKIIAETHEEDLDNVNMHITRETFLLVVQDPQVQDIFDDLEIQSEGRGRLFDVLDADGSGTLGLRELVQGLLRVRGEAQRSDVLAAVLGVRAVMEILKGHIDNMKDLKEIVESGACLEEVEDSPPQSPKKAVRPTLQEESVKEESLRDTTNWFSPRDTAKPTSKEAQQVFEMLTLSTPRSVSKHPPTYRGVASPCSRLDTSELLRNRRPPPRPIRQEVDNLVRQGERGGLQQNAKNAAPPPRRAFN